MPETGLQESARHGSVSVALPDGYGWRRTDRGNSRIFGKGDLSEAELARLASLLDAPGTSLEDIRRALTETGGFFALIVETPGRVLCCVDRIRSTPLIWHATDNGAVTVAQCADDLFDAEPEARTGRDAGQALAVAMAGFTIGEQTLYRDCKALLPGQFLLVDRTGDGPASLSTDAYHRYEPWRPQPESDESDDTACDSLAALTLEILEDTIRKADGRPILAPLSAGLDSRLVVSGLKHLGHENVICFAYGLAGNREAEASRAIAAKLGYKWAFTPYDNATMAKIFASDDYRSFMRHADSLTSIHFPQDYPAITALMEKGFLPPEGMVVNGQSGDFIAGNHIPKSLRKPEGQGLKDVIDALLAKHFTQWKFLNASEYEQRIAQCLEQEIAELAADEAVTLDEANPYGLYEVSEFVDRQSKYVVNGQRAYDYLGLSWDLPLWHDRYLDFWERQPLHRKAGQALYRHMLFEQNWGDVWRDIPVNATRLRPAWLRPVRFALKCAHAPLGRESWHRFETRYLAYHMSALCGYAVRTWREVAADKRGPRTALSFHIEDYLTHHGIDLDSVAAMSLS